MEISAQSGRMAVGRESMSLDLHQNKEQQC